MSRKKGDQMKYTKMPKGYGIVQTKVMQLRDLSPQGKAVYSLLASYTGGKEYCFPAVKTISKDLNLSKPMVIHYLKVLERKGLIKKSRLFDDSRRNNKYEVLFIPE